MPIAELMPGLPPYGPLATPFPAEWGRFAGEGTVVRFEAADGAWVGNFERGLGGLDFAGAHPDGKRAVVIARGDLWVVDPETRDAEQLLPSIDALLEVRGPAGWVFSRQGLALARLGPDDLIWHTRRLSWDGISDLKLVGNEVHGLAWSPFDERWHPFRVDARTGAAEGGSCDDPDADRWEQLAQPGGS